MTRRAPASLVNNVLWFLGSLVLAFFIWFVAVTDVDPIEQRTLRNVPIQFEVPEGLLIVNEPTRNVQVQVRAQRSVLTALLVDDVVVRADLRELSPGRHTVPLSVEVARPALPDVRPTQVTVELAREETQQKPVVINVTQPPPVGFGYEEPVPGVRQAEVSGAATQVAQVVSVRGMLNLSEQRNPVELDVNLTPVDADGHSVAQVEVTPRSIRVSVNVFQRDDVREVSVLPNLRFETLPEGFFISAIRSDPETIVVGGAPEVIAEIGETFFTEPIFLEGRTSDFDVTVPVELPNDDLFILSEESLITISVEISAQPSIRQLDNLPVEFIGADENQTVSITPNEISVVLNGPISVLNEIQPEDVQVVVDVNGRAAGIYELEPTVSLREGQRSVDNITRLPSTVNVTITNPQAENTETPTPPAEATAEAND